MIQITNIGVSVIDPLTRFPCRLRSWWIRRELFVTPSLMPITRNALSRQRPWNGSMNCKAEKLDYALKLIGDGTGGIIVCCIWADAFLRKGFIPQATSLDEQT